MTICTILNLNYGKKKNLRGYNNYNSHRNMCDHVVQAHIPLSFTYYRQRQNRTQNDMPWYQRSAVSDTDSKSSNIMTFV